MEKEWLGLLQGPPVRLLVVGDVMLDRTRTGVAERVSAEAPALVVRQEGVEEQPGGAGRVALFARALGAGVALAGAVGDDSDGRLLGELLDRQGIDSQGVVEVPGRPTTVKERLLARSAGTPAQLLRLDREERSPLPDAAARQLLKSVEAALDDCDAVLVADHGKGVCCPAVISELLRLAAARGVPVLVDPAKGCDPGRYRGAEALLPNRAEAQEALGRQIASPQDALEAARELARRSGAFAVLLKLDRDGMALARGGAAELLPSRARRVEDVTGAGDAVLAAAGLCRAARLPWPAAARVASLAAALKVERPCAACVTAQDLFAAAAAGREATDKLVSLDQMAALAEGYRRRGLTVVMSNGCFDLFHPGHAFCLEQAARLGDVLVVAVNSDASVRRLKGPGRPVIPQQDRAALVAALGCVGHVLVFGEDTPHEVLKRVRPDVLAKGGCYTPEQVVGREVVEGYGGRVCVTPQKGTHSTSNVISEVIRLSKPDHAA